MKKKIALVTSGAVSLGAYEAGVLYELFTVARQLAASGNFDYEIDVITGASAGSVNSVVFGLSTVYNPIFIKYLKDIWIDDLSIGHLLFALGSLTSQSLFSDRVIKNVQKRIIKSFKVDPDKNLPNRVQIGITLSNFSGLPYWLDYPKLKKGYKFTTFADWYQLELLRSVPPVKHQLEYLTEAAAASGAFPFAFPARKLRRSLADYAGTALTDKDDLNFTYLDGGIFNNEPINRAIELARKLDNGDERIYLLISPNPPEPLARFSDKPVITDVLKRLFYAVMTEAHFRDWKDAIKINKRLDWQEEFIDRMLALGPETLGKIDPSFAKLARKMAEFKAGLAEQAEQKLESGFKQEENGFVRHFTGAAKASDEKVTEYLNNNKDRIKRMLRDKEINRNTLGQSENSDAEDLLVNLVFVTECLGGLRDKAALELRPVFPIQKLAGGFWASFGGFLDQKIRKYDFYVGRLTAREFLEAETEGGLGLKKYMASLKPLDKPPLTEDEADKRKAWVKIKAGLSLVILGIALLAMLILFDILIIWSIGLLPILSKYYQLFLGAVFGLLFFPILKVSLLIMRGLLMIFREN
jgi:predicted acylesterase/phospholipase RssA